MVFKTFFAFAFSSIYLDIKLKKLENHLTLCDWAKMHMVEKLLSYFFNRQANLHVAAGTSTWVFSDVVWADDDISARLPETILGFKGVGDYFWH